MSSSRADVPQLPRDDCFRVALSSWLSFPQEEPTFPTQCPSSGFSVLRGIPAGRHHHTWESSSLPWQLVPHNIPWPRGWVGCMSFSGSVGYCPVPPESVVLCIICIGSVYNRLFLFFGFYLHIILWSYGLPQWLNVKNLPAMQETQVQSLGQEDPLEKGMATHSNILARKMPWTEEPAGL